MVRKFKYLTDEQVESFMNDGYLRLEGAFSREKADEWTKDVWVRLGMDPNDQTTWMREWTNMPHHRKELVETFSPIAWNAIGELVGGHDRIDPTMNTWSDGFIVNLGTPEHATQAPPHPKELNRWHCDGDFFLHFLDSPEQALLVVPLFTDIEPHGGGTMIAPDAIPKLAQYLADHPEGVMPTGFKFRAVADSCDNFVELTGKAGDVVLMHPLMLHSASRNNLRQPRIITNPAVSLREPFKFKRDDSNEYSLVELKTIKSLGKTPEEGYAFRAAGPRKSVVPERLKVQEEWKKQELERLARLKENDSQLVQPHFPQAGIEAA
ncbi:hypothetical protein BCR39DRAFT_559418 [Naematelia encephala]|uniref:Phytanoyl-CoA dioxygenase n=1 Tax=Naematelia encephala TaxID=71784 RepID=A0A1Y2B1B3_9TREE|nr:hypothetical protein BCR39DRAFT_559418 [Naematelia encephala]